MFDENFLKEQMQEIIDIQRKAYRAGFERGKEVGRQEKEKEIEDEGRALDAKVEQLEER